MVRPLILVQVQWIPPVAKLVETMASHWTGPNGILRASHNSAPHEAGVLHLNCDKAAALWLGDLY